MRLKALPTHILTSIEGIRRYQNLSTDCWESLGSAFPKPSSSCVSFASNSPRTQHSQLHFTFRPEHFASSANKRHFYTVSDSLKPSNSVTFLQNNRRTELFFILRPIDGEQCATNLIPNSSDFVRSISIPWKSMPHFNVLVHTFVILSSNRDESSTKPDNLWNARFMNLKALFGVETLTSIIARFAECVYKVTVRLCPNCSRIFTRLSAGLSLLSFRDVTMRCNTASTRWYRAFDLCAQPLLTLPDALAHHGHKQLPFDSQAHVLLTAQPFQYALYVICLLLWYGRHLSFSMSLLASFPQPKEYPALPVLSIMRLPWLPRCFYCYPPHQVHSQMAR